MKRDLSVLLAAALISGCATTSALVKWDDVCFGPSASCNVDWAAVGAVGTMIATAAALFIALGSEKVRRRSEERQRLAVISMLSPRIGNVADLMNEANDLIANAEDAGWSSDRTASEVAILFLDPPRHFDSHLFATLDPLLGMRLSELAGMLERMNQHALRCARASTAWHASSSMPPHLRQNISIDRIRLGHLIGVIALLTDASSGTDGIEVGTMLNCFLEKSDHWSAGRAQRIYGCSIEQLWFAIGVWHCSPKEQQREFAAVLHARLRSGASYDPELLKRFMLERTQSG